MSGYPYNSPGYGYAPPPPQPYSSAPYGSAPPPQQGQQPYAPVATPYAAPSAPYAPSKPPKEKPYGAPPQPSAGGYPAPPTSGGYPGPPSAGGYPSPAQPYGGGSPFASLMPSAFPPGTDPNIVACFQVADQDGSGLIDDKELQGALSSYNQSFSLRTVHLLMYLFTNSNSRRIVDPGNFKLKLITV
ncbi:calcium-binding EF-hand family protein [Actinidia rufa]|uniref:Calcium-binding EF-hand family protein n=1 Tax=Actinidia rufa TaxID=165716 RepID=A0A7J0DCW1_9ERIC|nr:calcium-binding EF-hand family protein [Actinidia rufa]